MDITRKDWLGTTRFLLLTLVSTHFLVVSRALCYVKCNPHKVPLVLGDVVSSLWLTESARKRGHMRAQLLRRLPTDATPLWGAWVEANVHRFRIIARPAEMHSLYHMTGADWLLVPDLPWEILYDVFGIIKEGSFLRRLRILKRVLVSFTAFCVKRRSGIWRLCSKVDMVI